MKKVVGKVVSTSQNAFVKGRQILDASLIANEVIDTWQKQKEKGIICKLDIEKAYDSINWKFLVKVLQKMGFGSKWVGWMWSCLSSAKFSVLVNGVPAGFFPSTKGLRQGDPLSPYLFIMGMEVLDVLIRRAVEGGFLSGCNIRDHLTYLGWILFWFEAASGLRINLAKSEIIPVGEVEEVEELAVELGCRVGTLPSQYLGLPLGAPNRAPYIWDGVEERVRRRLALWKRQYISKGGRVTLIKSTLASMPIYQMSIFRMPKVVVRRIEKVQRDFLWGGGNMERKVHLVKWEVVCTDKDKGGLGLRKLALLNKALLGKWIWRYACDKNNLWRQVIKVKYGQEGLDWRPNKANGAVGVGVWKEIWKESDWCWDNMTFRVGKGNMIGFWTDVWCSESPLSQCFPHLFGMAAHQNLTVEEMWDQNSGQGNWNLHFLRDFNDWEIELVGEFLHILRGFKPSLEEDSVLWRKGRSGQFRVKKAYSLLTESDDMGFPYKSIWVARVPTKVAFFAWEASWGRSSSKSSRSSRLESLKAFFSCQDLQDSKNASKIFFEVFENIECLEDLLQSLENLQGLKAFKRFLKLLKLDLNNAGQELEQLDLSPGAGWFYHGVLAFWVGCGKGEIMDFFREFHERGRFVRSLNATFLVLVPKKGSAEDLKDFRPISLVGSLYKLLVKVLANRIKKVMGKVISEPQNAFVEGRQILDAVLIANEVVDSRLKSNQGGVMCKLDIEKAYDHVYWKFLLAVLKKMGLGRDGLSG
ncbi:putative ribonuclease H protein [Vitis vinifera]|uniref:Putative ribonuclease H protein n=1 Tax=Vitis vinifera TaxID=29760 RepID=A0A438EBY1_VITVI|nr:putative ribonuclease H protein [Vitis vinifera]